MKKRIWLALIASSILVPGLPGRAVAQIDQSQAVRPEEVKRAILAARYGHDPRLIHPLPQKPASLADQGLQVYEQQADSGMDAASKAGTFTTFDAPGAGTGPNAGTEPFGINPAGAITGYYFTDANNVPHGFVRDPDGTIKTFDLPNDTGGTYPGGINSKGVIAGSYCEAVGGCPGFLRDRDGTITTFDIPGDATVSLMPNAINAKGEITGWYLDPNFALHGFVRDRDGTITTFDPPGSTGTNPASINPQGTVSGCYTDVNFMGHGFVRDRDGTITTFDVPGGTNVGGFSCFGFFNQVGPGAGINPAGAITGTYTTNTFRGFLRNPDGTFTTFDAPGAGTGVYQGTLGIAINPAGAITGYYLDANSVIHGFLRAREGTFTTLDAPGAGTGSGAATGLYQGTLGVAITPAGTITGYYVDSNNVRHGFLWRKDCDGEGHEKDCDAEDH